MQRDKPRELRRFRRNVSSRFWLANLLRESSLNLGAGVSICVLSCGAAGFAAADNGETSPAGTSGHQASEIRLMGADVRFMPIGQSSSCVKTAQEPGVSSSHPSQVELTEPSHCSAEELEPPQLVDAGVDVDKIVENIRRKSVSEKREAMPPGQANHPQILSIRRLELKSAPGKRVLATRTSESTPLTGPAPDAEPLARQQAVARVETPRLQWTAPSQPTKKTPEPKKLLPPSILVQSGGGEVAAPVESPPMDEQPAATVQVDAAEEPADPTTIASLPLLPVPNQQWVSSEANATIARSPRRHRPIAVVAPPTIAVAQSKARQPVRSQHDVPTRLAGYVRPSATSREATPAVAKTLTPTQRMMKEIHARYPDADVVLANVENRLVVRGNCDDRKQATEIIRLIRSQHLIPVDDQLIIR
ncbi:hypothetical protein [Allorhodopirellula solitaria]|uniref:Uncharacterized protein n=1 Tax=Allorhodopirellula solitaria TaxID=2527987 RepID=A0A5C5XS85_9BACT|nr:hypothetical protein [Allorhodopirellula solitaria]TWT65381.1 hypothetical protein CA85_32950 [Allorhodopirellula solitaria]